MGTIPPEMSGTLYCGDNLDVLREYVPAESVDLVYLDPPFNSKRIFNLIYKGSEAQEFAFKDHWSWEEAAPVFSSVVESSDVPKALRSMLRSLHDLLINDDAGLLAYLSMMTPRLVALHRVLKPTGSLYLHCDPTASHYLKVILDGLFGSRSFRNDITWKRNSAHSDGKQGAQHYGRISDAILFYSKSDTSTFSQLYGPYDPQYLAENYKRRDPDGRVYRIDNIQGPGGAAKGNPFYEFLGVKRYWRYSRERMQQLYDSGRIIQTKPGAVPQYKRYLDEMPGVPLQNVWTDIAVINNRSKEWIGYPTQKPLALLERILSVSSKPGDLVLDPFCGCGTTVEASERLGRRWIGIDIARTAVDVIEKRFDRVGLEPAQVIWHPADHESAVALAERDPLGFEAWVRRKVRANRRRKHDRGIDGESFFRDSAGHMTHALISVKGGKLNPAMVRDLRGTMERERVEIGVLVSLHEPSKEMRLEATHAGFLRVSDAEGPIPRLQLVTVDRLFSDLPAIRAPGYNVTEMPLPTVPTGKPAEQLALNLEPAKPTAKAKQRGSTSSEAVEPTPAKQSGKRARSAR